MKPGMWTMFLRRVTYCTAFAVSMTLAWPLAILRGVVLGVTIAWDLTK